MFLAFTLTSISGPSSRDHPQHIQAPKDALAAYKPLSGPLPAWRDRQGVKHVRPEQGPICLLGPPPQVGDSGEETVHVKRRLGASYVDGAEKDLPGDQYAAVETIWRIKKEKKTYWSVLVEASAAGGYKFPLVAMNDDSGEPFRRGPAEEREHLLEAQVRLGGRAE